MHLQPRTGCAILAVRAGRMLKLLRINNIALIPALELELGPGLTLLTGETGAGKSILIDALGLLLGCLGATAIFWGSIQALRQKRLKLLVAYSTVAQIGFILVGVGWGTPMAIAAAIVFAFNHSLIKAAMLMLAGSVASRRSRCSSSLTQPRFKRLLDGTTLTI